MNKMIRKHWLNVLLPVISAFLLITTISAAPTPITKDWNGTTEILPELAPKITNTVSLDKSNTISQTPNNTPPAKNGSESNRPSPNHAPQATRSSAAISSSKPEATPTTASIANAIIETGKAYIGVNYVYGGTSPSGFDCSGYVQYVFAKHGISLPRISRDQYRSGTSVSYTNLQPGDLVFFSLAKNGVVDHEGIYIGNGQFLNAASSKGVTIYTLGPYWQSAYVGARRVL
jgi:peptidoglycan DL-endopeptidase CwlO